MKNLCASLAAAFALTVTTIASASAAQITGSLNMYGDFVPAIGSTTTQNLAIANSIDFLPGSSGSTGSFITGIGTDDLSSFAFASGGTIQDLTFNPFSPVNDFYSLTVGGQTLSFNLTSLTVVSQNTSFLELSGTGVLDLNGYDPTAGTWVFSGQSSDGTAPQATFSWSAGSTATPASGVPEPASMTLVGLGLVATYLRRKRNTN